MTVGEVRRSNHQTLWPMLNGQQERVDTFPAPFRQFKQTVLPHYYSEPYSPILL